MTPEQMQELKKLGWGMDPHRYGSDRWQMLFRLALFFKIKSEHGHKQKLWDHGVQIIDEMTHSERTQCLKSDRKLAGLMARIALTQ